MDSPPHPSYPHRSTKNRKFKPRSKNIKPIAPPMIRPLNTSLRPPPIFTAPCITPAICLINAHNILGYHFKSLRPVLFSVTFFFKLCLQKLFNNLIIGSLQTLTHGTLLCSRIKEKKCCHPKLKIKFNASYKVL